MSRTIHTALDGNSDFGKLVVCSCPPEGDDDPNCTALLMQQQMEPARENMKLAPAARGIRDELAAINECGARGNEPHAENCPDPILPRSAVEIAMERVDSAVTVVDHRDTREVAIGQNPFVQTKEALLKEVVSSKYSLRRSALMRPERGRMIVARVEMSEQIGSIFLPQHVTDARTSQNMEVIVLGCGKLRIDPATGKEVPMEFAPKECAGKHAVIREHSGLEFIWYDENGKQWICYMIGQSEIWCWLEPPPGAEDEMQNSPEMKKALAYIQSGMAEPK